MVVELPIMLMLFAKVVLAFRSILIAAVVEVAKVTGDEVAR